MGPDRDQAQELRVPLPQCAHWLGVFRTFYGPMHKAFWALDAEKQEALATAPIALIERFNRATNGTLVAPSEYLEVVIKRKWFVDTA